MRDLGLLLKFRLALSVVVSAVAGYLIAVPQVDGLKLALLTLGGFAVVGSSNAFNQVWEVAQDGLMGRTQNRPLPAGRMTRQVALIWAVLFGVLGIAALAFLNFKTAAFGALSLLIYVLVYTPLKAKSPWAVLVGAVPGAIPFMLGWVAATGSFGLEPGVLFAYQFVWQFPHFWAIAWLSFDDYAKAGYYLLPNRAKDALATRLTLFYTFWMVLISLMPAWGLAGSLSLDLWAGVATGVLGIDVLYHALRHGSAQSDASARALMFSTIRYLPLVQTIWVVDRFI
ncbi:MAG: heme o synthase [Schleiferiaceae bacterium]|jgi:protoheme IX farnesyltransferase